MWWEGKGREGKMELPSLLLLFFYLAFSPLSRAEDKGGCFALLFFSFLFFTSIFSYLGFSFSWGVVGLFVLGGCLSVFFWFCVKSCVVLCCVVLCALFCSVLCLLLCCSSADTSKTLLRLPLSPLLLLLIFLPFSFTVISSVPLPPTAAVTELRGRQTEESVSVRLHSTSVAPRAHSPFLRGRSSCVRERWIRRGDAVVLDRMAMD